MTIKRFVADSWEEALKQVRTEFGESAVILQSKTFKEGGFLGVGQRSMVEVTASNDPELLRRNQTASEIATESGGDPRQNYGKLLEKAYAIASARAEAVDGRAEAVSDRVTIAAASSAQPAARPPVAAAASARNEVRAAAGGPQSPQQGRGVPAGGAAGSAIRPVPPATASAATGGGSGGKKPTASGLFRQSAIGGGNEQQRIESLMNDVSELKALVAQLATQREASLNDATPAIQAVYDRLLSNDVSPELARDIAARVNRELAGADLDDPERVNAMALRLVSAMIPVAGPVHLGFNKSTVIAFIGPTGVGKTTTLSKLAANLMMRDKRRVGFITIDTYRLGATEQLRTLANVLDVPIRVVMSPGEMRPAIREMGSLDAIFIDTAGRSHRDRMKMNELKSFLDAATPDETHLCVSATTHPSHMLSVLDHFGSLAVDRVVVTKLDEAATFGPVLEVILRAAKPVSYLTTGQDIPDDIEVATGERLARLTLSEDAMPE